jgi:hypothetical protein
VFVPVAHKELSLILDKAVHVVHKAVLVHKVQQERVHKVCKVLMDQ